MRGHVLASRIVRAIPITIVSLATWAQAESSPSCLTRPNVPAICDEDVRPHVQFLASPELQGRSGEGAVLAADYIVKQFATLGLRPLFEKSSYFQDILGRGESDEQTVSIGRNIGAWLPGRDPILRKEFIVVTAHYDHLGCRNGRIYAGADDNASGVAMLLEVGRQIAGLKTKPRRSVVFLSCDLEEQMLLGSRWFVAHPPWPLEQIKLVLVADIIGRSLGDLPLPDVFVFGTEHSVEAQRLLASVQPPDGLKVTRLATDMIGTRSDYGPFRDRKVPFLFFSNGEHKDYHTPRDVPERVDYEKLARVSTVMCQVCLEAAESELSPKWSEEAGTPLEEAETLYRITTLLLDPAASRPLAGLQRTVVTQMQLRAKQLAERNEITPADRKWLRRSIQLLLLTVF